MFRIEELQIADSEIKAFLQKDARLQHGARIPNYEEQDRILLEVNAKAEQIAHHRGLKGRARPFVLICFSHNAGFIDVCWTAEK